MIFSLSPFAPENLVLRDGVGRLVPRQPAHLQTQPESGAYLLRDSSRVPPMRPFIYLSHMHVHCIIIILLCRTRRVKYGEGNEKRITIIGSWRNYVW